MSSAYGLFDIIIKIEDVVNSETMIWSNQSETTFSRRVKLIQDQLFEDRISTVSDIYIKTLALNTPLTLEFVTMK